MQKKDKLLRFWKRLSGGIMVFCLCTAVISLLIFAIFGAVSFAAWDWPFDSFPWGVVRIASVIALVPAFGFAFSDEVVFDAKD